MKVFRLNRQLRLPRPIEQAFAFFTDACNLEKLTPPWLNFEILTPPPIEMKTGTLIDYRIRLHGIPLRWRTEITDWQPPFRFVDRQVRGPYRLWVHEHSFEACQGQTLLSDRVQYSVLGGLLAERLFVRRDVERIFDYRQEQMLRLFG